MSYELRVRFFSILDFRVTIDDLQRMRAAAEAPQLPQARLTSFRPFGAALWAGQSALQPPTAFRELRSPNFPKSSIVIRQSKIRNPLYTLPMRWRLSSRCGIPATRPRTDCRIATPTVPSGPLPLPLPLRPLLHSPPPPSSPSR